MNERVVLIGNASNGMYNFRLDLIKALKCKCYDVIVLVPLEGQDDNILNIGVKVINTPMNRRGINPKEDLGLIVRYVKILKSIKPSLVISYTIKPNIYAGIVCRLLNIPFVANITGLGTTFQRDNLLKKIVVFLYRISMKKAKVVFFENSNNRKVFIDHNIVDYKQTYLLNGAGVNLQHFQVLDYPADNSPTIFLFVGRIMKEKGIDELFAAMRELIDNGIQCHLNILGGFDEDYKEIIKGYEQEGWLTYYGYQKDVRPFIKEAHCFVLPSWHEGMANTNLENAACGRPVITSNIPGCKEAISDGVSGILVEPQNSHSLYEAMRKFSTLSYSERKKMGVEGRKRMEEMFDKKNVVQETIKRME